jgi:tRNA(fMet)-specific endonuclease VapC
MKFLLDTNICIFLIKEKSPELMQRFQEHQVGDIGVSTITIAELQYGIAKSQFPQKNQQALSQFLIPLIIADFDELAANKYGEIRKRLEAKGTPIGSLDMLIAAHALASNAAVVTNNTKEFNRVQDLEVVDWTV